MLKLYGFSKVNTGARGNTRDLRILWALEELGIPFEIVGMDHPAHGLETDGFEAINPFKQIPAIDDDGIVLTESAAILVYLAKKTGKLIPADLAGEAQVLRWCFAAVNTIELPLMNVMVIDWSPGAASNPVRPFMVKWAHRQLTGLDNWLEGREFIATDAFTVADILMAHVLSPIKDETLLAPHARVRAYRDRCTSRDAWRRTVAAYNERVEAA